MDGGPIEVRIARPADRCFAAAAERLIAAAVDDGDIARRTESLLEEKIAQGRAVVAVKDGELVGFGYFSEWEQGRFVSHSGLVVRQDVRRQGLARRIKERLFAASRRLFPDARIMSLTSSPAVEALNRSLGFRRVPLDELTSDPGFWKGCESCKKFAEMKRQGKKCCCFGMLLDPARPH